MSRVFMSDFYPAGFFWGKGVLVDFWAAGFFFGEGKLVRVFGGKWGFYVIMG
jgi:hypothetical protein